SCRRKSSLGSVARPLAVGLTASAAGARPKGRCSRKDKRRRDDRAAGPGQTDHQALSRCFSGFGEGDAAKATAARRTFAVFAVLQELSAKAGANPAGILDFRHCRQPRNSETRAGLERFDHCRKTSATLLI